MIVGFDGWYIGLESSAWGVTQLNIIRRLAAIDPRDTFVVFASKTGVAQLPPLANIRAVEVSRSAAGSAIRRTRAIKRAVRSEHINLDVYIETCEIAPRFDRGVVVFSIEHDFSEGRLEYPVSVARVRGLIYRHLHLRSISRANEFFCNSKFTMGQLSPYLSPHQRASVFPHGCDDAFLHANVGLKVSRGLAPNPDSQRYVLYVGRIQVRHKNFSTLLQAFCCFWRKHQGIRLFIVSSQDLTRRQRRLLGEARGNLVLLRGLKAREIADLYQEATALVLTSTYEGFGIPIIEAQNLRCPVVLTNIEVFREVADGGGIFFDGTAFDLEKKLEFVLSRENVEPYIENGLMNCRRYSWDASAELMKRSLDRTDSERGTAAG